MDKPPSKYDALYSMTFPQAQMVLEVGMVLRMSDRGKVRIVAIPAPSTVHYMMVAPWWHRLWRWASK